VLLTLANNETENMYTVTKKVVHQTHGDNFVNS